MDTSGFIDLNVQMVVQATSREYSLGTLDLVDLFHKAIKGYYCINCYSKLRAPVNSFVYYNPSF